MKRPSRHLLYSVGCALCVIAAVILSSSGSGGQARGAAAPARVSKAELQETIDWFANRNGDHQPGPAEMIETKATEAHFDVGEPADGVDPSFAGADVFLVTMRWALHRLPGSRPVARTAAERSSLDRRRRCHHRRNTDVESVQPPTDARAQPCTSRDDSIGCFHTLQRGSAPQPRLP